MIDGVACVAGHPNRRIESPSERRTAGFSYVEVVVATLILAIALVPALEALRTGLTAGENTTTRIEDHYHVLGLYEEVQAEAFAKLEAAAVSAGNHTTASSYGDAAGTPRRRLVYLASYDGDDADGDGDPWTGTDDGLLWLRVELEASDLVLESLVIR